MPAVRAILFDLDGTLIDSLQDIAAALNFGLQSCGLPTHPLERVRTFIGHGIAQLVAQAVAPDPVPPGLLEATRAYYRDHVCDFGQPYPGILELLERLRSRGIALGVLTNKPHALALDVVQIRFASSGLAVVRGDLQGQPKKPDPAGALEVIAALGVDPAQCLLVGDSVVDVQTARAARIRSVAVSWGFEDREALTEAEPDVLVDSVAALAALLDAGLDAGFETATGE